MRTVERFIPDRFYAPNDDISGAEQIPVGVRRGCANVTRGMDLPNPPACRSGVPHVHNVAHSEIRVVRNKALHGNGQMGMYADVS